MTRHYIGRIVPSIHHVFYELSLEQIQPTCTFIRWYTSIHFPFFLCFPSKRKVTATQGEQQLQRQKRMESIHRARDSQLFPPRSSFLFAFWRISENPKQLPKCHDDSWSIDVSSWFSHGKIVEDIMQDLSRSIVTLRLPSKMSGHIAMPSLGTCTGLKVSCFLTLFRVCCFTEGHPDIFSKWMIPGICHVFA